MLTDFVAGWVGGISTLLICHPMDTLKVRLQISRLHGTCHREEYYRNSIEAAIKIRRKEGIAAFYRGIAAPMAGIGIANAALFGVYGKATAYLTALRSQQASVEDPGLAGHLQNTTELTVLDNICCATLGGIAHTYVLTPFEVIRIRLQTESMFRHRQYFGAIHCARKIYGQGGVRKLYLGLGAALARDIPGAVVYFGSYGLLRQMLPQEDGASNVLSILFAGGCAGVAQWWLIFPLDTIKTRMQTAKEGMYIDWLHVARDLYKKEGVPAFYSGIAPALSRAFIANACCFAGVELSLKFMAQLNQ